VFDRLRNKYSDSFDCSYRTVAGYVADKKKEIFGKKTGFLHWNISLEKLKLILVIASFMKRKGSMMANT